MNHADKGWEFPETIYMSTSNVFIGVDPWIKLEKIKTTYLIPKFNKFLFDFWEKHPKEFQLKEFYITNWEFNEMLDTIEDKYKVLFKNVPKNSVKVEPFEIKWEMTWCLRESLKTYEGKLLRI